MSQRSFTSGNRQQNRDSSEHRPKVGRCVSCNVCNGWRRVGCPDLTSKSHRPANQPCAHLHLFPCLRFLPGAFLLFRRGRPATWKSEGRSFRSVCPALARNVNVASLRRPRGIPLDALERRDAGAGVNARQHGKIAAGGVDPDDAGSGRFPTPHRLARRRSAGARFGRVLSHRRRRRTIQD